MQTEKLKGWYPRCVYCGAPLKGERKRRVCAQHTDLVSKDPYFAEPDQWKAARA